MVGKYAITEQIGRGATCVVYEGYNRSTKERVAIKVIASESKRHLHLAANEVRVLQRLEHPNIIKIIETVETPRQTLIVLEKCKFSLSSIAKSGSVSYRTILRLFRDILVGLRYLHSKGVIHRDIKLGNVMISENNILKIIDFGLCKDTMFSAPKTFCGTPDFISPEVIERKPYTKKTDIYSAGILVYFLVFRCSYSAEKISAAKKTEKYGDLASLLEKMLEKNPEKRVSAEEALSNRIFASFLPKIIDTSGIKSFKMSTKLGNVEYNQEMIKMSGENGVFTISAGMNGIYQREKKTGEEVYIPFVVVDSKTLRLVEFCYSLLGLVKKRTPVVIILTDKGKFFKMMKDGIYVYITDSQYILWQNGEITLRRDEKDKKDEKESFYEHSEIDREEMQILIYESINALNTNKHLSLPVTIDKRTTKKGTLRHSMYQSLGMPSAESASLANLSPNGYTPKRCIYTPLFVPTGCFLRLEPYVFALFCGNNELLVLSAREHTLTRYSTKEEKEIYKISENTPHYILHKVVLFEAALIYINKL